MSPASCRILERLPTAATATYREACEARGKRRVELLRETQDSVDAGSAGMVAVWGLLQAELTDADEEAAS
jgi:hypothetical protein